MKANTWFIVFMVSLLVVVTTSFAEEITYQWAEQGDVAFYEANGKIGLIGKDGRVLHPAEFDQVSAFDSNGVSKVMVNGKTGMMNRLGEEIIEPMICSFLGYIEVENGFTEIHDEAIAYKDLQNRWGFFSFEGQLISDAQWEDTYGFINGSAYVRKNGVWNMIDIEGQLLLDDWWESIEIGAQGKAYLWSSESGIDVDAQGQICATYAIDETGNQKQLTYGQKSIAPYEQVHSLYRNGYCAYAVNDLWGILDSDGEQLTEPLWEEVLAVQAPEMLFRVCKDSLMGWINAQGEYVLAPEWNSLQQVEDDRWVGVHENEEVWLLDDWGDRLFMLGSNYDYVFSHGDGIIEYRTTDGYWGFYDSDGDLLSKVSESEVKQDVFAEYSEGWIQVEMRDGSPALMNAAGTILFSPQWTRISPFYNGYAIVRVDGKEGYVDPSGTLVHPAIWEKCNAYRNVNGQLIASVRFPGDETWSVINEHGHTICGRKLKRSK